MAVERGSSSAGQPSRCRSFRASSGSYGMPHVAEAQDHVHSLRLQLLHAAPRHRGDGREIQPRDVRREAHVLRLRRDQAEDAHAQVPEVLDDPGIHPVHRLPRRRIHQVGIDGREVGALHELLRVLLALVEVVVAQGEGVVAGLVHEVHDGPAPGERTHGGALEDVAGVEHEQVAALALHVAPHALQQRDHGGAAAEPRREVPAHVGGPGGIDAAVHVVRMDHGEPHDLRVRRHRRARKGHDARDRGEQAGGGATDGTTRHGGHPPRISQREPTVRNMEVPLSSTRSFLIRVSPPKTASSKRSW